VTHPHHGHEQGQSDGQMVPVWAVELYNDVRSVQAHADRLERDLFEQTQRLDRFMADYAQAAADAEQAMTLEQGQIADLNTKVSDLQAALAAAPTVDPAVQAAADALEAQAQAVLQAATPAAPADGSAPAAPADGGAAPADGGAPADTSVTSDGSPVDPTAPADPTVTDGSDASASEAPPAA
jgi:septal ring factor EnvC (AmiA/AmiB activator)